MGLHAISNSDCEDSSCNSKLQWVDGTSFSFSSSFMDKVEFKKDEYITIKEDKGDGEFKSHKDSKEKASICQVKCIIPSE